MQQRCEGQPCRSVGWWMQWPSMEINSPFLLPASQSKPWCHNSRGGLIQGPGPGARPGPGHSSSRCGSQTGSRAEHQQQPSRQASATAPQLSALVGLRASVIASCYEDRLRLAAHLASPTLPCHIASCDVCSRENRAVCLPGELHSLCKTLFSLHSALCGLQAGERIACSARK